MDSHNNFAFEHVAQYERGTFSFQYLANNCKYLDVEVSAIAAEIASFVEAQIQAEARRIETQAGSAHRLRNNSLDVGTDCKRRKKNASKEKCIEVKMH